MTALEQAKAELRAALEGAGLTPEQVRAISPAVARFAASAVRADRAREARAWEAHVERMVRKLGVR